MGQEILKMAAKDTVMTPAVKKINTRLTFQSIPKESIDNKLDSDEDDFQKQLEKSESDSEIDNDDEIMKAVEKNIRGEEGHSETENNSGECNTKDHFETEPIEVYMSDNEYEIKNDAEEGKSKSEKDEEIKLMADEDDDFIKQPEESESNSEIDDDEIMKAVMKMAEKNIRGEEGHSETEKNKGECGTKDHLK